MTDSFNLTPGESVRVLRDEPGHRGRGHLGPGGSPPPKHFHPAQDERFEVLEGALTARVDGEERELESGDVLEIPRGAVHQMWNAGERRPARPGGRHRPGAPGSGSRRSTRCAAPAESAATACRARSPSAPTSPSTATSSAWRGPNRSCARRSSARSARPAEGLPARREPSQRWPYSPWLPSLQRRWRCRGTAHAGRRGPGLRPRRSCSRAAPRRRSRTGSSRRPPPAARSYVRVDVELHGIFGPPAPAISRTGRTSTR